MNAAHYIAGFLALAAAVSVNAGPGDCRPGKWLADPGITPAVLEANDYRVVTRQTLSLDDGRQAIETVAVDGPRTVKCRVVFDPAGEVVETACYLPCRNG